MNDYPRKHPPPPTQPRHPQTQFPCQLWQPRDPSHSPNLNSEPLNSKKKLRFALPCIYFSDLFTDAKILYSKNFKFVLDVFYKDQANCSLSVSAFNSGAVNKDIKSKRKFCTQ